MRCGKHSLEHTNFWSNNSGGVIYGCQQGDNKEEIKHLTELLKGRKEEYETFGRTLEDARQDNEIHIKIQKLKTR